MIHIAMIFDPSFANKVNQAVSTYCKYNRRQAFFHLLMIGSFPTISLIPYGPKISYKIYNVQPHGLKAMSVSGYLVPRPSTIIDLVQLSLHEILSVNKVIYLDIDVTITGDISVCFDQNLGSKMMALGVDMGDVCQKFPERCWPIAQMVQFPQSVVCGQNQINLKTCAPYRNMSFQYNFGVALLNLEMMRRSNFTANFVMSTQKNGRLVSHRRAYWGGQEMINSFVLDFPELLDDLPCGCNYQIAGVHRRLLCPNTEVVIAHLWYVSRFKNSRI